MTTTWRHTWARVAGEGVVIIGSILIAFAIDALWEARQEAELTREHLEALVSEFRSVQDELRRESNGVASSAESERSELPSKLTRTAAIPC